MDLKNRIKERAEELGFCKIGFTSMDDLPRVCEEARRREYPEFLLGLAERGSHPRQIAPEARSIIVLAYDYSEIDYPESLLPYIGRFYLSHSFMPREGTPARGRLDAFESYLAEEGVDFEPDRIQLMIRPAALRAGVISFGRNNFAYVDGVGSFVTLYGYFTTCEFEPDEPAPNCLCPPHCHACIDACPMDAMGEPFNLDASKCMVWVNALSYSRAGVRDIPEGLRDKLGLHVHGCDACQAVCPRNQKALRREKTSDPLLEQISSEFSLEKLLHMPDGFYQRCVRPIMYNYVDDPVAFQRNAAIAMGNSGDARYVQDLRMELGNPDETIRSHVLWALNKLEGQVEDGETTSV
ncbi:epoxyqueuosine reductase [Adlercreutzia sp. ZJ473]|uniref:epoxyqueuosine reductase n=1 Tax=Adlercreutzia sp. ZJ473 TaxID=2722822 RepID=UPI001553880F|nr:epoxyqueuosine reductase [Adlercreutzia sp. ZJ473]